MLAMALAFVLAVMPSALAEDEAQLQIAGGNASGDVFQVVFYERAGRTYGGNAERSD